VYLFSFYLYVVAATLIVAPNMLLQTLGIPTTTEVWIRVVGVLAACLGYYYMRMGAAGNPAFCLFTVHARIFVCVAFTAFAVLNLVSPMLVGFGLVDLACAAWTWMALRQDAKG
jgi:hypothetical protein